MEMRDQTKQPPMNRNGGGNGSNFRPGFPVTTREPPRGWTVLLATNTRNTPRAVILSRGNYSARNAIIDSVLVALRAGR